VDEVKREQMILNAPLGGTLSDPVGMLEDVMGRFEDVPDRPSTLQRAQELCERQQVEDGRFYVEYCNDMDIVIVLHPKPQLVKDPLGRDIAVDRYMVFGRKLDGKKQGTCYACNNADRRHGPDQRGLVVKTRNPQAIHKGDCWRERWMDNWTPLLFAWAHGYDDAEDLAMELRSAWSATAEQMLDDNGKKDWSRIVETNLDGNNRREFSFSSDYLAGMMAANPNAWSSLSADDQSAIDVDN